MRCFVIRFDNMHMYFHIEIMESLTIIADDLFLKIKSELYSIFFVVDDFFSVLCTN